MKHLLTPAIAELPKSTEGKKAFIAAAILLSGIMGSCKNAESATEMPPVVPTPTSYLATYPSPPRQRPDAKYTIGYTMGCKDWMVRVPGQRLDFCIDRFEAIVVELQNGREIDHFPSVHPKRNVKLAAKISPDSFPQSSISRFQAIQACENSGKRLCTMSEWKRACMGVQQFTFPYGNEEIFGKCNTRKEHFLTKNYGKDSKKWNMNDPIINMFAGLEKPGTHSECVSSFGAYDMVGNLHEWVLVDESNQPKPRKRDPFAHGVFMGGFFSSANQNGNGCNYATSAHLPDHYDNSTGFRCCADVDDTPQQ